MATKKAQKQDAPEVQAAPTMDGRFEIEHADGLLAYCQLSPREKSWAIHEARRGCEGLDDQPNNADYGTAVMRVGLRSIARTDGTVLYDEDQIAEMKRRTSSVRALPFDAEILDDEAVFPAGTLALAGVLLVQQVNAARTEGNS